MNYKEEFIAYLQIEKQYASHTITAYRSDLEQFFIYINAVYGELQLAEISHSIIRSWIVSLMNDELTARSVNRKISTLKSYYHYLIRNKHVEINPMQKITSPKMAKRLPEYVEEPQLANLLEHIPFDEGFEGQRNKLILEMFYTCGLRRSELIHLQRRNVDYYNMQLKVLGKGGKERIVPLSTDLKLHMQQYEKICVTPQTEDAAYFFLTASGEKMYDSLVYRIVKQHLQLVTTIKKKSPHVLRHSFATHLSNNGADLNAIKELLGHSSLAATQVYTHNSIEKLKHAYKNAHPRS